MIKNIIKELGSKKNILILGFGREGKTSYSLIRKYLPNKKLTIADMNTKLLDQNEYLKNDKNTTLVLGDSYLDNLSDYDCIIKSPGINFKFIDFSNIINNITSQIELFLKYTNCFTIGVTGTKGKSTTSTLIAEVLNKTNKKAILVGNIGIPVFEKIEEFKEDDIIVIELSCHQLQFIKSSPNIAIMLNIFQEHLDLYKSYDEYIDTKINMFKYQKSTDYNIWGIDSKESYSRIIRNNNTYEVSTDRAKIKSNKAVYIKDNAIYLMKNHISKEVYSKENKRLILGDHNLFNIGVVFAVSDILNLDFEKIVKIVSNFKPLKNRIELIGEYNKIYFYNDTFSTIPETTISCIKSIDNIDSVILGGLDRKIDLTMLINYLLSKECKLTNCICLPETGHQIAKELKSKNTNKNVLIAKDMEEAVKLAYKYTKKGSACALSPSSASYNAYKSAEEKTQDYIDLIKKYE